MTEFDKLEQKAEAYAEEHPEQAGQPVNEVTELDEHDPDNQHDKQIDRAVEAADQRAGHERQS